MLDFQRWVMMMRRVSLLAPTNVGLAFLLLSCNTSELTRPKAKRILEKVAADSSITQISLSSDQALRLLKTKDSLAFFAKFSTGRARPCLPDGSDVRIMAGDFALCPSPLPEITWQHPGWMIALRRPIKWTIFEITGITDGQNLNEKVVEYTWQYDYSPFPKEGADVLKVPIRKGKAVIRLYDDGWRFVNFM
jgi:hypothetical protein